VPDMDDKTLRADIDGSPALVGGATPMNAKALRPSEEKGASPKDSGMGKGRPADMPSTGPKGGAGQAKAEESS
jgi:hypothetical protein